MRLNNLKTNEKDSKTMTCGTCNELVRFDYVILPVYRKNMYRNRNWLNQKYTIEQKTMSEIGDMCGKSAMTIRDWLQRHEIPIRSRGRR